MIKVAQTFIIGTAVICRAPCMTLSRRKNNEPRERHSGEDGVLVMRTRAEGDGLLEIQDQTHARRDITDGAACSPSRPCDSSDPLSAESS